MSEMPIDEMLAFDQADRLGKALRVKHVGKGEMAEYLGVSRNTIGNYVNGHTSPDLRTLRLWALRCGVPLEWLRTGTITTTDPDGGSSGATDNFSGSSDPSTSS